MSALTPITSGCHRICPLCERFVTNVTLYNTWVCEDCRNSYVGRRLLAFAIDLVVLALLCVLITGVLLTSLGPSAAAVWTSSVVLNLLFLFRDAWHGTSPGKRLLGLRVLDERTRQPAGASASFRRNFLLLVPGLILIEPILLIRGQRLGDAWARTLVGWEKHARRYPFWVPGSHCDRCGYDLTGNTSGRCPECGSPVPPETRRMLAART